jgi:abnormal spindle-like microcephaly-associated protein
MSTNKANHHHHHGSSSTNINHHSSKADSNAQCDGGPAMMGKSGRPVLTPHKAAKDKKKSVSMSHEQKSFVSDNTIAENGSGTTGSSCVVEEAAPTATQQFQTQAPSSTIKSTAPPHFALKSGQTTSSTCTTTTNTSISAKSAIATESERSESIMSKRRRLLSSETTTFDPTTTSRLSHQSQSSSSPSSSIHLATLIQQPPDLTLIPSVGSADFDDTNLSFDSNSTLFSFDDDGAPAANKVQEENGLVDLQEQSSQLPANASEHVRHHDAVNQGESTADQLLVTPAGNPDFSVVATRSGGVKMDLSPLFASPAAKAKKPKPKPKAPPKQAVAIAIPKETSAVNGPTPVLTLGNFQESIWLDFGDEGENVVGKTRSYPFLVKAPSSLDDVDAVTLVEVEKVPTKKGFLLQCYDNNCSSSNEGDGSSSSSQIMSGGRFVIKVTQGCSVRCALLWTPAESGGMREVVHLKLFRGRMRIMAQGSARDMSKAKITTTRAKGERPQLTARPTHTGQVPPSRLGPRSTAPPANKMPPHTTTPAVRATSGSTINYTPQALCSIKTPYTGNTMHTQPLSAAKSVLAITPLKESTRALPKDDAWAEKQSESFIQWMNFVLSPPDQLLGDEEVQQTLHKEGLLAHSLGGRTFDRHALRTLLLHRAMTESRRKANGIFNNRGMTSLRTELQRAVAKQQLSIRSDRDMLFDLGCRDKFFELLFSFSLSWLHLGLETLFGRDIRLTTSVSNTTNEAAAGTPVKVSVARGTLFDFWLYFWCCTLISYRLSSLDPLSWIEPQAPSKRRLLKAFIIENLLDDKAIKERYTFGKCKVPSGKFAKRYHAERKQHTLFHTLVLVTLLDQLKAKNVLSRAPRLFRIAAELKSSNEFLVSFCREFMSGEGNVIKHLAHLGLTVSYKQSKLDEFDFAFNNLASDIRDGIRLSRLVELLSDDAELSLTSKMRVPAVSRLQKIHNADVALKALRRVPVPGTEHIRSNHLVDGHRDKVFLLLWSIFAHYKLSSLLNPAVVRSEIRAIYLDGKMTVSGHRETSEMHFNDEHIDATTNDEISCLLLDWCRAIGSKFGIERVDNFTTSFMDGRLLCLLIHYYHPTILAHKHIASISSLSSRRSTTFTSVQKRTTTPGPGSQNNEHQYFNNFALAKAAVSELGGCPPMLPSGVTSSLDENTMIISLSYIFSRLVESRNEVRAARVIQNAFGRLMRHRTTEKQVESASVMWRYWQLHKSAYRVAVQAKYGPSARIIVNFLRRSQHKAAHLKIVRQYESRTESAAIAIQTAVRGSLCRLNLWTTHFCVTEMQRAWRGHSARANYFLCSYGFTHLQANWRGQSDRRIFLSKQRCALMLQLRVRCRTRSQAAITLQTFLRGVHARIQLQVLQRVESRRQLLAQEELEVHEWACLTIQTAYRARQDQQLYMIQREAAVSIQSAFRGHLNALVQESAALMIQIMWTRHLEQKQNAMLLFAYDSYAATEIQRIWRRTSAQVKFLDCLVSAIVIQGFSRKAAASRRYRNQRDCAILVQSVVRRSQVQQGQLAANQSAVVIQTFSRKAAASQRYRNQRECAIVVQSVVRRSQVQHRQLAVNQSAVVIQKMIRGHVTAVCFQDMRVHAVTIQSFTRKVKAARICLERATVAALVKQEEQELLSFSSIQIQRAWRGFTSRSQYTVTRHAATTIQAEFRSSKARSTYNLTLDNVIRLQSFLRGSLFRQNLFILAYSAGELQRAWRGNQGRLMKARMQAQVEQRKQSRAATLIVNGFRKLCKERRSIEDTRKRIAATTLIQTSWRCYDGRHHFMEHLISSIVLQCEIRRSMAAHKYTTQKNSALSIQRVIRGHSARKTGTLQVGAAIEIQSFLRMRNHVQVYQAKTQAAQLIQKMVRNKAMHTAQAHCSSIMIQMMCRGYIVRQLFSRQVEAAICMQTMCRIVMAKQVLEMRQHAAQKVQDAQLLHSQCLSATRIQRQARGLLARQNWDLQLAGTVRLQATLRSWKASRMYKKQVCATATVQHFARGCLTRRSLQQKHQAAQTLQRTWRGFRCMDRYFVTLVFAVVIQSAVRGAFVRKEHAKMHRSATSLQKIVRGFNTRSGLITFHFAASLVQGRWRALASQKKQSLQLLHEKEALRSSSMTVQRLARGFLVKRALEREQSAAQTLQRTWRGFQCMGAYVNTLVSAIIIQSAVRGASIRNSCTYLHDSATGLQRIVRGYQARTKFHTIHFAASLVQRGWRAHALLKKQTIQLLQEKEALRSSSLSIQRFARGFLARRALEREQKAAQTFQRIWRGVQCMGAYFETLVSAIVIQGAVRGTSVRKQLAKRQYGSIGLQRIVRGYQARTKFHTIHFAASLVQRRWRAHALLKKQTIQLLQEKEALRASSLSVQRLARGFLARRALEREQTAAQTLQRTWRGVQCMSAYVDTLVSAIVIQGAVRGASVRKQLAKRQYGSIGLQRIVRGYQARTEFDTLHFAASLVQRRWRAHELLKKEAIHLREQGALWAQSVNIQRFTRGFLSRRRLDQNHKAATTLQCTWRGATCMERYTYIQISTVIIQSALRGASIRNYYTYLHDSAIGLQRIVRGYQARTKFDTLHFAASLVQRRWRAHALLKKEAIHVREQAALRAQSVNIQRFTRGFLSRRRLDQNHKAATTLQCTWRGAICMERYMYIQISTVIIQSALRGASIRNHCTKLHDSATGLQKMIRGSNARASLGMLHFAASLVQGSWRDHAERKKKWQALVATIKLQSFARTALAKKEKLFAMEVIAQRRVCNEAATQLQRVYRGYSSQVSFLLLLYSATVVQASFRGLLERKRAEAQMTAATKIQALTRAFLVRKAVQEANGLDYLHNLLPNAVTAIQAMHRGAEVRVQSSKAVRAAARRIKKANEHAKQNPKLTLGWQTRRALYILTTSTRLSEIFEAVQRLEVSTRLSWECRLSCANADLPNIFYDQMKRCNRSLPHIELMKILLGTICNIAQTQNLMPSIAKGECVNVMVDVIQTFRDKEEIFCRATWILHKAYCLLSANSVLNITAAQHLSAEHFKRLRGVHSLHKRKLTLMGTNKPAPIRRHDRNHKASTHQEGRWNVQLGMKLLASILS